jgi:DNA-binding MurR/RpiR family transcriptional regulator
MTLFFCLLKSRKEYNWSYKVGGSMLIVHKLERTHFSPSEAKIVDFILKEGEKIRNMSISFIANETYTSPPLLIRIAKKLGYSGWNEFKEDYLKEIEYLYKSSDIDASIPFVVSDDYMNISHNIATLEIETIQDTISLLKHDDLYQAMRYLRDASRIDIYGVSSSIILAEEFARKMSFINQNVFISRYSEDSKLQAANSDETHVAILISYSGETGYILQVAKKLKQKKTPIIAITSIGDNSLSKEANVVLRISSKEMLHTKIGDFASTQSIKLILDTLYGCIFSMNYTHNLDHKISLAKEEEDRYSGFEYIDEK